jgi:hypothetical protein
MFARVMFHYGLSDRHVLRMPMRRFMFLNAQINRLLAEKDLRDLGTATAAQSPDGTKNLQERLVLELGETVKVDPLEAEPEEGAISTLAALAALPTRR